MWHIRGDIQIQSPHHFLDSNSTITKKMSPLRAGSPFKPQGSLAGGSVAITQAVLCVQTVFDSIKCNTGSSNLHVSIQVPDNGSGVLL